MNPRCHALSALAACTFALVLSAPAAAAPASLDRTFQGGKVSTRLELATQAMALQGDGKIVVTGTTGDGIDTDVGLLRFEPNGGLDPSFGNAGRFEIDLGGLDTPGDVALQPDGKIVVAATSDSELVLLRHNPDGTLDGSFGQGGIHRSTPRDFNVDVSGIALQPDGRIVVVGSIDHDDLSFLVTRHNVDGSLDASFGDAGVQVTDFGRSDSAADVLIQPDGKLVVAGSSEGDADDFALARYNPDGALDASLGTGGMLTTDVRGKDHAFALQLLPNGRILVAGTSTRGANSDAALVRYMPDGSLDTSFGRRGAQTTDTRTFESTESVALQQDGKILIGGTSGGDFLLTRYTAGGGLDPTFGSGGIITPTFAGDDVGSAVAVQPDGKILIAGNSARGVALARYQGGRGRARVAGSCSEMRARTLRACLRKRCGGRSGRRLGACVRRVTRARRT